MSCYLQLIHPTSSSIQRSLSNRLRTLDRPPTDIDISNTSRRSGGFGSTPQERYARQSHTGPRKKSSHMAESVPGPVTPTGGASP